MEFKIYTLIIKRGNIKKLFAKYHFVGGTYMGCRRKLLIKKENYILFFLWLYFINILYKKLFHSILRIPYLNENE